MSTNIDTLQKHIDDLQYKVTVLTDQLLEEYAENHSDNSRKTLMNVMGEREFYARLIEGYELEYRDERNAVARLIRG